MNRININIRDGLTADDALKRVLNGYIHGLDETNHGVVTFEDDTAISLRETKAGNLSFTVYKTGRKDE